MDDPNADGRRQSINDSSLAFDEDLTDVPVGLVFDETSAPGGGPGRAPAQAEPPSGPQGGGSLGSGQGPYGDFSHPIDYANFPIESQGPTQTGAEGALPPLVAQAPAPPVKRPRGRPRKVPGTESRPPGSAPPKSSNHPRSSGATGRPRGRPKGSRGTRGAKSAGGTKRTREEEDQESEEEKERLAREQGRIVVENGQFKLLDANEEAPDDFDASGERLPNGPITKFGRKVTKPQPYQPQSKPPVKKKRPSTILPTAALDPHANLTCQVCQKGHSPAPNQLVLCEVCDKGWHQLCAEPPIDDAVVSSDKAWHCRSCDVKRAQAMQVFNVTQGPWSDGNGSFPREMKQEWLESLPLTTLVGYILSVEQKYAPRFGLPALDMWPHDLPQIIGNARAAKAELEAQNAARDGTPFSLGASQTDERKPLEASLGAMPTNSAAPLSRSVFSKPFGPGGGPSPGPDSPNSRQSPLAGSVHYFSNQSSPILHQPQAHHPHQQPPPLPQMGQGPPGGAYNPAQGRAPLPPFMREPNAGAPFGGQPGQGMHGLMSHPSSSHHPSNSLSSLPPPPPPGQQGGGGAPYMPHQPGPYSHLPSFRNQFQQPGQLNTSLPFPGGYAPGGAHPHSPLLSGSPHQSPQLGTTTRSPHLGHGRGAGSGGGSVGQPSPQVGHSSQLADGRPPSSAGSMANVLGGPAGGYAPNGRGGGPTLPPPGAYQNGLYAPYNGGPPGGGGAWAGPSSLVPSHLSHHHAPHPSQGGIGGLVHHGQAGEGPGNAYSPDLAMIGGFADQRRSAEQSAHFAQGHHPQGQPLGGPAAVQERDRWSFSGSSQGGGQ